MFIFAKRKISVIGVVIIIGITWLFNVNAVQSVTVEELLAQIAELQAKIEALRAQLAELQPPAGTYEGIPAGFSFENNLKYGMRNNEVKYLQIVLKKEVGPPTYPERVLATGYFGLITKNSVIKFQEKYASEILTPYRLTKGTGFVGKSTRTKLNQLLVEKHPSCIPSVPSLPSLLSPTDGTTNQSISPTLSWQAPDNWGLGCPDNKKYRIQVDDNSDFSSLSVNATTLSHLVTSFTISDLLSHNTIYYWRVRAENNAQYSDWNTRSFRTSAALALSVSLSANPSSGKAPLDVELTAQVSGITTGPANYIFYCNRSDPGTDVIPGYNKRANYVFSSSYTDICNYPSPGTYTAKIIVERGGLAAESRVVINVTSPLFDFSLSVNPTSGSVVQGYKPISATLSVFSNSSQAVSFFTVDLPSGASASFSPSSCLPTLGLGTLASLGVSLLSEEPIWTHSCYSTMIINTAPTTPTGIFPIAIIGTGGGLTKGTPYFLTVTGPILSVSLSANPSSGTVPLNGVGLTATVSGTATGPINYTFYCNRSDSGTNITPGYNHKKDGTALNPYTALGVCNYTSAGTYTAKVIVERGTLVAESRVPINVTSPPMGKIDLDVIYIERVPRYYRYDVVYPNNLPVVRPGTEDNKRWPAVGESVTYTAHIINKGDTNVVKFDYQFLVSGSIVSSSTSGPIQPNQELTVQYNTTRPSSPQSITFRVDPNNSIAETVETNNSLTIGSHDLTISYWVEKPLYDIFNRTKNLVGSYSFEDWIQAHFAQMNERFSQAKYPVAPNGIRDRVRIDKIVVADQLDVWCPPNPMNTDPDVFLIDGRWQSTDGTCDNSSGLGGQYQSYVDEFVNQIDWGLIHEVAHQLGIIDLYRLGIPPDPNAIQVKNNYGQVIGISQLPPIFPHGGLMGGGDTSPYNNGTYFESHTAGGMNSHYNHRRGYFGEYLFDTPDENYLKILDASGSPLSGAEVALYQKNTNTEFIDNIPEITGTTDAQGIMFLTNRPVNGVTTATGHTLKNNPFGQIHWEGKDGTMLVKITKGIQENYRWLFILDLNLAYWSGNTNSATYIIKTNL